jgi:hypothetical protein
MTKAGFVVLAPRGASFTSIPRISKNENHSLFYLYKQFSSNSKELNWTPIPVRMMWTGHQFQFRWYELVNSSSSNDTNWWPIPVQSNENYLNNSGSLNWYGTVTYLLESVKSCEWFSFVDIITAFICGSEKLLKISFFLTN